MERLRWSGGRASVRFESRELSLQLRDRSPRPFAAPFGGAELLLESRDLARAELDLLPGGAQRPCDASVVVASNALPFEPCALLGELALGVRARLCLPREALSFGFRFGEALSLGFRFDDGSRCGVGV
jgi:hypothetical protein